MCGNKARALGYQLQAFALVAEPCCRAMAADNGRNWNRDDGIVVDKDGVPHYTGQQPGLMREYRRRVLFAFSNLGGEGGDATKEA